MAYREIAVSALWVKQMWNSHGLREVKAKMQHWITALVQGLQASASQESCVFPLHKTGVASFLTKSLSHFENSQLSCSCQNPAKLKLRQQRAAPDSSLSCALNWCFGAELWFMIRICVKVKVLLLSCNPCTDFRAVTEGAVSFWPWQQCSLD